MLTATTNGKRIHARRRASVETVLGAIRQVMKFGQFGMRGRAGAQIEWNLDIMD